MNNNHSHKLNDSFNYTLNGISHEIPIHSNLIIHQNPLQDKLLISQKFILKYIHDFLQFHSIDYFIIHNTLLGYHLFQGIHIFYPTIEICLNQHHLPKFIKLKEEIIRDGFTFHESQHHIILSSSFFQKSNVELIIHILYSNEDELQLYHFQYPEKTKINHLLYDIYPLQNVKYEEFNVSVPNKITKVLENCQFNLNFIQFKNSNQKKREIIQNDDTTSTTSNSTLENIQHSIFNTFHEIKNNLTFKI